MAMHETYNAPGKDFLFAAVQIFPVVPGKITMTVAGTRGALVTSAGALATTLSEAYAVLAADAEANTEAPVYLTGEFNATALAEATGIEVADGAIIANRIFVRTNISA